MPRWLTIHSVNIDFDYFSRHSEGCVLRRPASAFPLTVAIQSLQGWNGDAILLVGIERVTHAPSSLARVTRGAGHVPRTTERGVRQLTIDGCNVNAILQSAQLEPFRDE